jgi:hypothetical protein
MATWLVLGLGAVARALEVRTDHAWNRIDRQSVSGRDRLESSLMF